jgi:hypothetical protein
MQSTHEKTFQQYRLAKYVFFHTLFAYGEEKDGKKEKAVGMPSSPVDTCI